MMKWASLLLQSLKVIIVDRLNQADLVWLRPRWEENMNTANFGFLRILIFGICFSSLIFFFCSCTDSNVEITETLGVEEVDDQLTIHGEVCTDPPTNAEFPVKIMFIIDCSGSMQQTDEGDHRVEAVRQVVRRYANNPQIYFDIIKFNGFVANLTGGFTNKLSGNESDVFGPQGLLEADSMTDYQGGLGEAYRALLDDMITTANGSGGI